jgi:hypothetical protein
MHLVAEVPFGVTCKTKLWLSFAAAKDVDRFRRKGDPNGIFWKKVRRYCENGFEMYEISQWPPLVHEGDGVYRLGIIESMFRIIGFYGDGGKVEFIGIDTFLKKDQDLNATEKRRVKEVIRVKKARDWKKVEHAPQLRIFEGP